MSFEAIPFLEWSALGVAILWTVGLWSILMGTRRARRFFRGKGYLRPPTGKAWLRFIYYKHYESFEDPAIRFYYRLARMCLFIFVFLVVAVVIFIGSVLVLTHVSTETPTTGG
jgi:hypothetical protein